MNQKFKSWTYKEAQSLLKAHGPFKDGDTILFETGFGPSGLPHIGTFAEVARTTWVHEAFEKLSGHKTELIAFSDDMDGLRKVPLNLPKKEMLTEHLGKPLSTIPDPFECCDSFSDHMNGKLKDFLDAFKFKYKFQSSSEAYKSGVFNEGLKRILEKYDDIGNLILPTLRKASRENWSPIMPICPECGRVYTTIVKEIFPEKGEIAFSCSNEFGETKGCGASGTMPVTDGNVKVGWKIDWALRWFSYGINYEMYGKDLIESARLSAKICRILGKKPPVGLFYEMFLDENGEKISKSVGKGLTVETWMDYAPIESLLYYIWQNPKKAKRLFFGMIPKVVDDYLNKLKTYPDMAEEKKQDSVIYQLFNGEPPTYDSSISFSLVNNLVSTVGADDSDLLYRYLSKYDENTEKNEKTIKDLVGKSLNFYRDFILPGKSYEKPDEEMKPLFVELHKQLSNNPEKDSLMSIPFNIAKENDIKPALFFKAIYKALLGQDQGPRFGPFVKLIGVEKLVEMLGKVID
jgi:lysyl-tRNA synthetase, class I